MDISILEDIGLTGAEIKVFLALLELGSTTAGHIVEKSGLQNAVVHRAFHSLKEKGLLTYVMKGKIKYYDSIEPGQLLDFLEEKKNKLNEILPELEKRRDFAKNKSKTSVYEGVKGVRELIRSMIQQESKSYVAYGGQQAAHDILGDLFWKSYHMERIRRSVDARIIFHESLREWGDYLNTQKHTQLRFTTREMEGNTETFVCGNRIAIVIFTEKPVGILIEEREVADSYRKFFEVLWNNSKN